MVWAGTDRDAGVSVILWSVQGGFKTIYYHLNDVIVEAGDIIKVGQTIGHTGNSGKYTTGAHLHFGLKETNGQGKTINWNNGYKGAIDPRPHLPKRWDSPPVYNGYGKIKLGFGGRKRLGEEIKLGYSLPIKLRRYVSYLEIKAIVYGGWRIEDIQNPALKFNWLYTRRDEFTRGIAPTFGIKYRIIN